MSDDPRHHIDEQIAEAKEKFDKAMGRAVAESVLGVILPDEPAPGHPHGPTPLEAEATYFDSLSELRCLLLCLLDELRRQALAASEQRPYDPYAYRTCLKRCQVGSRQLAAVLTLAEVGARAVRLVESELEA